MLAKGIRAEHAVAKILVHNFSPPKFLIVFIFFKHILSFLDTYKVVSAFFKKKRQKFWCAWGSVKLDSIRNFKLCIFILYEHETMNL